MSEGGSIKLSMSNAWRYEKNIFASYVFIVIYSITTAPTPVYNLSKSSDEPYLGDSYEIQCTAYTDEMINPNNVTVSWTGPNGTITNDSRLTITPTISNGTSHNSTLQFSNLSENDEGEYICNLVMFGTELSGSESIVLSGKSMQL